MRAARALACVAVAAALCVARGAAPERVVVDRGSGQYVEREGGRVRLFHGVNVVYKLKPFYPEMGRFDVHTSVADEDVENLRRWGMNVVRLGVMWSSVELAPGVYNTTYLGVMRKLVQRLGDAGIYTIVDAHQDVLHRAFCGEGIPDFAVSPLRGPLLEFPAPLPLDLHRGADGMPDLAECQKHAFFEYYFTFAAGQAWGELYTNATLQELFAGSWRAVASAFRDQPSVLAYELLNEPWAGNLWTDPLAPLWPGLTDSKYLAPLYARLHARIREVDEDTVVMYEPSVVESYLRQPSGFMSGPGGPEYDDRQAFAYHIYCQGQNATGDIENVEFCVKLQESVYETVDGDRARLGGGAFLTEFGAVGPHESSAQTLEHLAGLADARLQSWAYWSFKSFHDITTQNPTTETFYNDDGSLQRTKIAALARTYPQAVAGHPDSISFSFDPATHLFQLRYRVNAAAVGPTEIYVSPDFHYPTGRLVTIAPATVAAAHDADEAHVHVVHAADVQDGTEVTITISPQ